MNLIYMAKPTYGGWVSFTAHLANKYNYKIYKITKRTEKKTRKFGYGAEYQNLTIEDAVKLPNILITAIDKKYYEYLSQFPDNTSLVIHDPTEIKGKSTQPVIDNLDRLNIFTIRKTVHELLKTKFNKQNTFKHHPLYEYPFETQIKNRNVSISRVDFDKNTHEIIKANDNLPENLQVQIYGAKNDLYVYHCLQNKMKLDLDKYYKGTFKKGFDELSNILSTAKFVVDLSAIKGDGGGSQYTFLEAIYQNCVLILNKKWVDNVETEFKHNHNCYVVEDAEELESLLKSNPPTENILKNARELLQPHINAEW